MTSRGTAGNQAESGTACEPRSRDFLHLGGKSPALRVFVIDDEPLIRWSLAEALTASGHEVAEAGDARSALGTLSAAWPGRPFDVVLLDLRLPDAHDLSVLARLRALVPDVPVILMTADATPDIARGAMELGVYRIVSKPFDPFRLAALAVEAYDASSW